MIQTILNDHGGYTVEGVVDNCYGGVTSLITIYVDAVRGVHIGSCGTLTSLSLDDAKLAIAVYGQAIAEAERIHKILEGE